MHSPRLNARFNKFITWIRPDPDAREDGRKQRDEVRDRIKGKAEGDGLTVEQMPNSGSFEKATGLRRHMLGDGEHEGQDIDAPFVLSKVDENGAMLADLIPRFERFAKAAYPNTPLALTKSSVKVKFVASKRDFDLVPLLAVTGVPDEQILLRRDGERRRTSVQKHVDFVRARTTSSKETTGVVAFNDAVRLVKWWREYQLTQHHVLDEVPTFLLELLCAHAFDKVGVQEGWAETLQRWFDCMQHHADGRVDIVFKDFRAGTIAPANDLWRVLDPVNDQNNAVPEAWSGIHIDELRDLARDARDRLQQAVAHDMRGNDSTAIDVLTDVFGAPFKTHSE